MVGVTVNRDEYTLKTHLRVCPQCGVRHPLHGWGWRYVQGALVCGDECHAAFQTKCALQLATLEFDGALFEWPCVHGTDGAYVDHSICSHCVHEKLEDDGVQ